MNNLIQNYEIILNHLELTCGEGARQISLQAAFWHNLVILFQLPLL